MLRLESNKKKEKHAYIHDKHLNFIFNFFKSTLAFFAAVNPLVWVGIAVALTAVIGFVVYRAFGPKQNALPSKIELNDKTFILKMKRLMEMIEPGDFFQPGR